MYFDFDHCYNNKVLVNISCTRSSFFVLKNVVCFLQACYSTGMLLLLLPQYIFGILYTIPLNVDMSFHYRNMTILEVLYKVLYIPYCIFSCFCIQNLQRYISCISSFPSTSIKHFTRVPMLVHSTFWHSIVPWYNYVIFSPLGGNIRLVNTYE